MMSCIVLSDPGKREKYDKYGDIEDFDFDYNDFINHFDFSAIFSSVLGGVMKLYHRQCSNLFLVWIHEPRHQNIELETWLETKSSQTENERSTSYPDTHGEHSSDVPRDF